MTSSRPLVVRAIRYLLLLVAAVLTFNTASAFLAVYFRQRPGAAGRPGGLGNYLLVFVSRYRDRHIAGRRFFPLWALVHHRGRVSGRVYVAPVAIRATSHEFVIPVLFGPHSQWLRNVQDAGGCVIGWRGEDHYVTAPELIGPAEARAYFGRLSWFISEMIVAPEHFVRLRRVSIKSF